MSEMNASSDAATDKKDRLFTHITKKTHHFFGRKNQNKAEKRDKRSLVNYVNLDNEKCMIRLHHLDFV